MPLDAICLSDLVGFSPTHHSFAVSKSELCRINLKATREMRMYWSYLSVWIDVCIFVCLHLFLIPKVHPMNVNLQKVAVLYLNFRISQKGYSPLAMFLLVMFQYHLLLHPGNLIQIWFVAATSLVTLLSLLPMLCWSTLARWWTKFLKNVFKNQNLSLLDTGYTPPKTNMAMDNHHFLWHIHLHSCLFVQLSS